MTIQEAIEKAIEGGWRPKGLECERKPLSWIKQAAVNRSKFVERYFLDPLFWQSLGKELWPQRSLDDAFHPRWKQEWHRFIDHLAEGKDAESFFKSLT